MIFSSFFELVFIPLAIWSKWFETKSLLELQEQNQPFIACKIYFKKKRFYIIWKRKAG